MTAGQRLSAKADKARELLAQNEFSQTVVLAACQAAASQGHKTVTIAPSVHVDLRTVPSVIAMMKALSAEHLRLDWSSRQPSPEHTPYFVLNVRWGGKDEF